MSRKSANVVPADDSPGSSSEQMSDDRILPEKLRYLHGRLKIQILCASNIPPSDGPFGFMSPWLASKFARLYCFTPWLSDPYVVVNSCNIKGVKDGMDLSSVEESDGTLGESENHKESERSKRISEISGSFSWSNTRLPGRGLTSFMSAPGLGKDPHISHRAQTRLAKTSVKWNTFNPTWNETFIMDVCHPIVNHLLFIVRDKDFKSSDTLGYAAIPMSQLHEDKCVEGTYILHRYPKQCVGSTGIQQPYTGTQPRMTLTIKVEFMPLDASKPSFGLPLSTYYVPQSGVKLDLFQSAHQIPGQLPSVKLGNGQMYSTKSCWNSLYKDMQNAHSYILICGWAVSASIRLVRTNISGKTPCDGQPTLGELLKKKAASGVQVLIMVWGDLAATAVGTGFADLKTHFKGVKNITVAVMKRWGGVATGNAWTHHQKFVLIDTPPVISNTQPRSASPSRVKFGRYRKRSNSTGSDCGNVDGKSINMVAYVGGIDLFLGRYDDANKTITRGADTLFKDDWVNPSFSSSTASRNSRQPWQDVHCRMQGKACIGIFLNFVERWYRQCGFFSSRARIKRVGRKKYAVALARLFDALPDDVFHAIAQCGWGIGKKSFASRLLNASDSVMTALNIGIAARQTDEKGVFTRKAFAKAASKSHRVLFANLKPFRGEQVRNDLKVGLAIKESDDVLNEGGKYKQSSSHKDSENVVEKIKELRKRALSSSELKTMKRSDQDVDTSDTFRVTILRSIDNRSARLGKQENFYDQAALTSKGGRVVEKSIENAYVWVIRNARRYLYFENQYWIGSSYIWSQDQKAGATNIIPAEIVARIVRAIKAGDPFHVYVCIPMFPEGPPASQPMQHILHFQRNTVEAMYHEISVAIEALGSQAHPSDYLSFYCLGKRELHPNHEPGNAQPGVKRTASWTKGKKQINTNKYRRFMIYVHSKLLVADDEVVILGSANINDRSMCGVKDSEIGVLLQTEDENGNVRDEEAAAQTQIYGFRQSLWAEHCGAHESDRKRNFKYDASVLSRPESPECIAYMRELGRHNWDAYASPIDSTGSNSMEGHIMAYPFTVDQCGKLSDLPDTSTFPDFSGARIKGTRTFLPAFVFT